MQMSAFFSPMLISEREKKAEPKLRDTYSTSVCHPVQEAWIRNAELGFWQRLRNGHLSTSDRATSLSSSLWSIQPWPLGAVFVLYFEHCFDIFIFFHRQRQVTGASSAFPYTFSCLIWYDISFNRLLKGYQPCSGTVNMPLSLNIAKTDGNLLHV